MNDVLPMPAGKELDVRVAKSVMGMKPPTAKGLIFTPPHYSTRDEDALALFHFLNEQGWNVSIHAAGIPPRQSYRVDVYCGRGPCERHGNKEHDWHGVESVVADSLALALSRAAVYAVESPSACRRLGL